MITGVSNTRNILLPNQRKMVNSKTVNTTNINTTDVFIRANKNNEDVNFKGSEEAQKIFQELLKEHPDKAEVIKNLQSITEVVPFADFPIWLAGTARKVLKGDFTTAGVQSLLYAADNSVLLPVKTAFVTAVGVKGAAIGSVFPGLGNAIGGIVGAGGALLAWAGVRNKVGEEIAKLIEDDSKSGGGSSAGSSTSSSSSSSSDGYDYYSSDDDDDEERRRFEDHLFDTM